MKVTRIIATDRPERERKDTTMTDKTLIEILEAATEGSRALDNLIYKEDVARNPTVSGEEMLHYTTIIDAALTWTPEGSVLDLHFGRDHKGEIYWCRVLGEEAFGATPALSICIANAKARELI